MAKKFAVKEAWLHINGKMIKLKPIDMSAFQEIDLSKVRGGKSNIELNKKRW